MRQLHNATIISLVTASLLAAAAVLAPVAAEAAHAAENDRTDTAVPDLPLEPQTVLDDAGVTGPDLPFESRTALEETALTRNPALEPGPKPDGAVAASLSATGPEHLIATRPTVVQASADRSNRWRATAGGSPWEPPVGGPDLLTGFDPPPLPWMPGHRGVDLAAADGQSVLAAGAGRVVFAGDLAGRGVVSIAHANGLRTTYEPVEPLVAAGEQVAAGQAVGRLQPGHRSCSGAVCLHLGLKRGPLYLDPMLLFGAGKVRLLPRPGRAAHMAAPADGGTAAPDLDCAPHPATALERPLTETASIPARITGEPDTVRRMARCTADQTGTRP
jgi:murein DD-endopeptidase MepM/ murein hydrolase activator NlpD